MRKILLLLFPMLLMADVLSKDDYKYAIQYFYKNCDEYLYKEFDSDAKVCGYIDFLLGWNKYQDDDRIRYTYFYLLGIFTTLITQDKEAEEQLLGTGLNIYFYDDEKNNKAGVPFSFCKTTKGLKTHRVISCYNIIDGLSQLRF